METEQPRSEEEVRQASAPFAETLRTEGESVARHAREAGENVFNEQRAIVACSAQHLASALHTASTQLREQGEAFIGSYTDWAANSLDRFSEQITREDFDGFISRASRYTRERPEIVFGGALLAGIALTRLLKYGASEPREPIPASETAAGLPTEPMETTERVAPATAPETAAYRTE